MNIKEVHPLKHLTKYERNSLNDKENRPFNKKVNQTPDDADNDLPPDRQDIILKDGIFL